MNLVLVSMFMRCFDRFLSVRSVHKEEQLGCDMGRHRMQSREQHRNALGNFDTGCINSALSLEILLFLVFNVLAGSDLVILV